MSAAATFSIGSPEWNKVVEEVHEISKNTPDQKTDWARVPQWDMANAHYTFLQAFAQAYKHADTAPDSDAHNYLRFVKAVVSSIDVHHETEETVYFPALEKDGKLQMESAVEQHKVFHDGLKTLEAYLAAQLEKRKADSSARVIEPAEIRRQLDAVAGPLASHLRAELDTLDPAAVGAKFSKADIDRIMKAVLDEILKHDMSEFMPLCLTNCATDNNSTWPPIPWPVRYVIGPLVIGWKTMSLWKYSAHGSYAKFPY